MLIDTHTHLYSAEFDSDREAAVRRAVDEGVRVMMCPAVDSESHGQLIDLCRSFPDNCLPMMGLHPTSVNDNPNYRYELEEVERLLKNPPLEKFYAIGEVGLDLHWSRDFEREQREVFERQIELSFQYSLPLVIHTRQAWEPMKETLGKYAASGLRGVMHAFSGSLEDYKDIKELGDFVFGIGGVVTYKKSTLPEVVREMALADIVLETDSPYLTPVPYRGKRNESAYLPYICNKIAEIKNLTPEEVATITTENARRVFSIT